MVHYASLIDITQVIAVFLSGYDWVLCSYSPDLHSYSFRSDIWSHGVCRQQECNGTWEQHGWWPDRPQVWAFPASAGSTLVKKKSANVEFAWMSVDCHFIHFSLKYVLLVSGWKQWRKSVVFLVMPLTRPFITKAHNFSVAKAYTAHARWDGDSGHWYTSSKVTFRVWCKV